MERRLHLYYGDGKGKTSAGMGLALRALGHGKRALIAQFMKTGQSGELNALRLIPGATVFDMKPVRGFLFRMTEEERARTIAEQNQEAVRLRQTIELEKPDLILLDELAVAWAHGVVSEKNGIALVNAALACGETAVTGRDAPDWLREHADYVSRIIAERHPYDTEGLTAREGVEW